MNNINEYSVLYKCFLYKCFQPLNMSEKSYISDVWLGSGYVSGVILLVIVIT